MNGSFLRNVFLKGLALFLLVDLALVVVSPTALGKVSLYNHIFPGRLQFPFGEDPTQSYNFKPVQPGCHVCIASDCSEA